jgi:hypothetical protein
MDDKDKPGPVPFIMLLNILNGMKGEMESYNTVVDADADEEKRHLDADKRRLYSKFTRTLGDVTKLLKKHL